MRAARLWHDSSVAKSHIERAGDEQFLELDPPRAQPLLVHVFGDRFEHHAGCLEAVSQRIVIGQRAVDARIEQSRFEIPLQMGLAVARYFLLRRHECRIKVECDPGVALEQRAPHHDRMVDRKQAGLGVKAPAFSGGIGEEVTRHPRDIDRSDTSNSAKRSCRQNISEGCTTVTTGLIPCGTTRPSISGRVRSLSDSAMLSSSREAVMNAIAGWGKSLA